MTTSEIPGAHQHAGHGHSGHGHGGHGHGDPGPSQRRALWISTGANAVLLVVQVAVGVVVGSLALLADSMHNASDVLALVIALVGQHLATRPPTRRRTYGLARAEILAALMNAVVLVALTLWVLIAAVARFSDPPELAATPLMIIGLVGLVVNGGSAVLLHRSGGDNLNLRAAFWHLVSDALGSVGVVAAGAAVALFDAGWVDPAVSVLISVLVLAGVWRLLSDTVAVLLEATPAGLDPEVTALALIEIDGVRAAHHVHIWSVDSQTIALTAHLLMADGLDLHATQLATTAARELLQERFGITHVTLETECHDCVSPDHVV